jgi:alpha-galactosidase
MKQFFFSVLTLLCMHLSAQGGSGLFAGPPVFHGASVIGCHPNTDFLFVLPATGARPIEFDAQDLPAGLTIDRKTGFVTGRVAAPGEYKVQVVAMNSAGNVREEIRIVMGEKLCLTPPMGWNSWNVFTSEVSEKLLIEMADAMAGNGMRDLGYEYINIDDFWHAAEREADGRPKADPVKFPHGMKYLSDYMHSKGLKLGIYSCAGHMTCGKCFGGYSHEEIDARTYAEWGIDLLKYDYCFAPWGRKAAEERYSKMGTALKNSGRSIVFSICEWGIRKPWLWAAKDGGSYWRMTPDIFDTWSHGTPWQMSVMSILRREKGLEKYAGPGHWNDPDMLLVGNHGTGKATSAKGQFKGLTQDEYRTHFAMWCMLAAPLLTSCDLRTVSKEDMAIMTDVGLLEISQDALGEQATLIKKQNGLWYYRKKLSIGSYAVAVVNTGGDGRSYSFDDKDFGLTEKKKFALISIHKPTPVDIGKPGEVIPSHATAIYIVTYTYK